MLVVLFMCLVPSYSYPVKPNYLFVNVTENTQQNHTTYKPKNYHGKTTKALDYLHQFGYLPKGIDNAEALYREDSIERAIRKMQFFGGIPQTGILDNATLQLMGTPRCGVPDIPELYRRRKRFVIGGGGWNKRNITYYLANWSGKFESHGEALEIIRKAFDVWSGYARLHFTSVPYSDADIIIMFARGPHGDGYPFDGPGGVLAHAYYPYESGSYGGDIHFDDDEYWEVNKDDAEKENAHEWSSGVDFFTVVVHEIGHSLGLAHSPIPGSIMYPYYKGEANHHFQLDYDDILAMYQLYITRKLEGDDEIVTALPEIPEPRPPPTDVPLPPPELPPETPEYDNTDKDDYPTFDDKGGDEEDVFKDWEPSANSTETPTQYPSIPVHTYDGDYETVEEHQNHADLPPTVTSGDTPPDICDGHYDAISVIRGEIFIFKDQYLWRLAKKARILPGYPIPFRQLFHQFPEWVQRIDAVYQRPHDGHMVFFTGRWFWIYDGDTFLQKNGERFIDVNKSVCDHCKRPLRDLEIPAGLSRVDAALVWKKNGKTYFFSSNLYWRYNETMQRMDRGYPHDIARWRGVPYDLDSAFRYTDGMTYFFQGVDFWRFDDAAVKTDPDYPLPAPQVWAGCSELLADLTLYG